MEEKEISPYLFKKQENGIRVITKLGDNLAILRHETAQYALE